MSVRPDCAAANAYIERMNTVHLSDAELRLARSAMQAYLRSFGHDEAETVEAIKRVIAKLAAAELEDNSSTPNG